MKFKPSPEYLRAHPEVAQALGLDLDGHPLRGKGTGRRSKYGAVRTEYNGRTYASKLEASFARRLDELKAAGVVLGWVPQMRYDLGAGIAYAADFLVMYAEGENRVIDAKGYETPEFRLKRKLFRERYGFDLDVLKNPAHIPTKGR